MDINSTVNAFASFYDHVVPGNPALPYFELGWRYMTENYSKFAIATYGTILIHEVRTIDLTSGTTLQEVTVL